MKYIPHLFLLLVSFVLSSTDDFELNKKYKITKITPGNAVDFPKKDDTVAVHYSGTYLNGTKFASSRDSNDPFHFILGDGQGIKGWEEVVNHMSVGEKIYFICPSQYAYGSRGAGEIIPPDTDIAFEIELLKIYKANPSSDL